MANSADAILSQAVWGVAARPFPLEIKSGDAHVLVPTSRGFLAAVIDGLGHGIEAEAAARRAAATLREFADDTVSQLMRRCHLELCGTRGAVLSLASVSYETESMTWVGVGNVEGLLFKEGNTQVQQRESLLLRGGVVGYEMPFLREATLAIQFGDTLVLASDGICSGFMAQSPIGCDLQEYADEVLSKWGKSSDDALVLAVRYLGRPV
jgi:negative regulator of sigma-B (phosphoserine phosphatase)